MCFVASNCLVKGVCVVVRVMGWGLGTAGHRGG